MRAYTSALVLLLVITGLVLGLSVAPAQQEAAQPAPAQSAQIQQSSAPPSAEAAARRQRSADRVARTALIDSMQERLALEKEQLARLDEQIAMETDPLKAAQLQREVRKVKTDAEISLLQMQLKYYQARGRSERAEQMRRQIEHLSDPTTRSSPLAPLRRGAD